MSKFCIYCGSEIDNNASICPSCGSNQTPAEENAPSAITPEGSSANGGMIDIKTQPKKMKIILIAVAAVLVIVILIVLRLIFSSSYTAPIDNMIKAQETGKGKYIYECYPEFVLEERYRTGKKSKIMDQLDELAEMLHDNMEDRYGEDFNISYKIKDKEEIDEDDLEDIEKYIKKNYKERVNISAGWKVKVKLRTKGEYDRDTDTETFNIYKINGDWCFIDTEI